MFCSVDLFGGSGSVQLLIFPQTHLKGFNNSGLHSNTISVGNTHMLWRKTAVVDEFGSYQMSAKLQNSSLVFEKFLPVLPRFTTYLNNLLIIGWTF